MENGNKEFLSILSNMIQLFNCAQNMEQASKDDLLLKATRQNKKCLEEILNILKEKL